MRAGSDSSLDWCKTHQIGQILGSRSKFLSHHDPSVPLQAPARRTSNNANHTAALQPKARLLGLE